VDIPRSLLSADLTLSRLLTESNFWLGPSQIVAAVNMPDLEDKMNICLISEEGEGKEGEWYTLGDLEKLKKKFAHFAPVVEKMLELAKPEDCYIWRLSEMPPLERWMSESERGRW
jgi:salicylate hydroxylase